MIKKAKNKDMADAPVAKENKGVAQEYFFAGGTEYKPVTIVADSKEEAEALYLKTRVQI